MENFDIDSFISAHQLSDGFFHEDCYEDIFEYLAEFSSEKDQFADAVDELLVNVLGEKAEWTLETQPNFTIPSDHIICSVIHKEHAYDLIFFTSTREFVNYFVSIHALPEPSEEHLTFQDPLELGKMNFRGAPFPFAIIPTAPDYSLAAQFGEVAEHEDRKKGIEELFRHMETLGTKVAQHHRDHVSQIDKPTLIAHISSQITEVEDLFVKYAPKEVKASFYGNYLPKLYQKIAAISDTFHAAVASVHNVDFRHMELTDKNLIIDRQSSMATLNYQKDLFYGSPVWVEANIKAEIEKHSLENGLNGEEIKLLIDSFEDGYKFTLPDQLYDEALEDVSLALAYLYRWVSFFMLFEKSNDVGPVHTWYAKKLHQILPDITVH